MALNTLGTNATTSLSALKYQAGGTQWTQANIAALAALIKSPSSVDNYGQIYGAFNFEGQLVVPGRGALRLLPGDTVAVDSAGFPIIIPLRSLTIGGSVWTFT